MVFRLRDAACALAFVLVLAPCARAQSADAQALRAAIDNLKKDFDQRLAALEARLAAVESGQRGTPATAREPAAVPQSATGASVTNAKVFNPDMAVIGDFLGALGRTNIDPANHITPDPAFQMHESEAAFQAVVDPYARADFFISFGEHGVDLEEGFLTFTELPGGLLTKVGKMRAAFGKVNTLHNHVLPWADRPLVINNLVGGEDGISDAGISVARLIPNPWIFLEATGQVFRGDSGPQERPLFQTSERSDLSYVAHLRGYQDITEDSNIDLGLSYSRGHNTAGFVDGVDTGGFTTSLYGVDATFRWRPLQRSIYRSFLGRSELIR